MVENTNGAVAPVDAPAPLSRNERDNIIIKRAFKDNDALLLAMRAVMLGLGPTVTEKNMVSEAFASEELFAAVSQRFVPQMLKEDPIGTLHEVWKGVEKMSFGYSRDTIEQALKYKERGIEMAKQALALLRNPDADPVDLSVKIDVVKDPLGIDLLTRNMVISLVEEHLVELKVIAAQKDETPEEKKKRAAKESAE